MSQIANSHKAQLSRGQNNTFLPSSAQVQAKLGWVSLIIDFSSPHILRHHLHISCATTIRNSSEIAGNQRHLQVCCRNSDSHTFKHDMTLMNVTLRSRLAQLTLSLAQLSPRLLWCIFSWPYVFWCFEKHENQYNKVWPILNIWRIECWIKVIVFDGTKWT